MFKSWVCECGRVNIIDNCHRCSLSKIEAMERLQKRLGSVAKANNFQRINKMEEEK